MGFESLKESLRRVGPTGLRKCARNRGGATGPATLRIQVLLPALLLEQVLPVPFLLPLVPDSNPMARRGRMPCPAESKHVANSCEQ